MNRREKLGLAALLVVLLGVYAQVVWQRSAAIGGYDGQYYYATLRSLVFDRDFDCRNELEILTVYPESLHPVTVPSTGKAANKYGVGYAVVSLVPYLLVHVGFLLHSMLTGQGPATGYELPYQVAATSAHVVAGWLALVLMYGIARRHFGWQASSRALIFTLMGTPLLFYACDSACMAHAAGAFAVALLVYCTVATLESAAFRAAPWVGIGSAAGIAVTLRFSDVVFLAIPAAALVVLERAADDRRARLSLARGVALAVVSAAPFLVLQMLQWKSVFGSWLAYSYGDEGFNWLHPELLGTLFSHRHGLGFYSPVSLLGLAGLAWLFARNTPVSASVSGPMLISFAALWYLNSAWWCWWFAHGFGARAFVEASPAVMIGLAALLAAESRPVRSAAVAAGWAGTAWTVLLLVLWYSGSVAPDGRTTLPEIVEALRRVAASGAL